MDGQATPSCWEFFLPPYFLNEFFFTKVKWPILESPPPLRTIIPYSLLSHFPVNNERVSKWFTKWHHKSMVSRTLLWRIFVYIQHHTGAKFRFLSKNTLFKKSNFCPKIQFWQNPNIFTSFSPKFFWQFFLVKSKLSTAKMS